METSLVWRAFSWALGGFILILLYLSLFNFASAHMAPTDWPYNPWCCGGQDCAPIPPTAVTPTETGYLVHLKPGDHPLVSAEYTWLVPYDNLRPDVIGACYNIAPRLGGDATGAQTCLHTTPDGLGFHACFYPNFPNLRCLYAPPSSF